MQSYHVLPLLSSPIPSFTTFRNLVYPVYQMIARIGAHDAGHLPHRQTEACVLERPLHRAPSEVPQIAIVLARRAVAPSGRYNITSHNDIEEKGERQRGRAEVGGDGAGEKRIGISVL